MYVEHIRAIAVKSKNDVVTYEQLSKTSKESNLRKWNISLYRQADNISEKIMQLTNNTCKYSSAF